MRSTTPRRAVTCLALACDELYLVPSPDHLQSLRGSRLSWGREREGPVALVTSRQTFVHCCHYCRLPIMARHILARRENAATTLGAMALVAAIPSGSPMPPLPRFNDQVRKLSAGLSRLGSPGERALRKDKESRLILVGMALLLVLLAASWIMSRPKLTRSHPICIKTPKALWHRERCYNRSMPEGRRLVGLGLADPTRLASTPLASVRHWKWKCAIN